MGDALPAPIVRWLKGVFGAAPGDPGTLGTLPICGVPCTTGAPGGAICPLPSNASPPRAAPAKGDQGGILLRRSFSFWFGGGVIGACEYGDQSGVLPGAGALP